MIELVRDGKGWHREVMELPSLEKINPIFTNVYLQLNCSAIDCNYLFKSSPDLFFNSFNKAIVNDFVSH